MGTRIKAEAFAREYGHGCLLEKTGTLESMPSEVAVVQ